MKGVSKEKVENVLEREAFAQVTLTHAPLRVWAAGIQYDFNRRSFVIQ